MSVELDEGAIERLGSVERKNTGIKWTTRMGDAGTKRNLQVIVRKIQYRTPKMIYDGEQRLEDWCQFIFQQPYARNI